MSPCFRTVAAAVCFCLPVAGVLAAPPVLRADVPGTATPGTAAPGTAAPGADATPTSPPAAAPPPGDAAPRYSPAPPRYEDKFKLLAREIDEIVERGYVIVGSPDEVAEQLREVALDLNVGHLMLLMQFGNMSKELTRYNTKLFAERVMPQMRDLFADWEDRWWPQPMPTAARASVAPLRPHAAAAE